MFIDQSVDNQTVRTGDRPLGSYSSSEVLVEARTAFWGNDPPIGPLKSSADLSCRSEAFLRRSRTLVGALLVGAQQWAESALRAGTRPAPTPQTWPALPVRALFPCHLTVPGRPAGWRAEASADLLRKVRGFSPLVEDEPGTYITGPRYDSSGGPIVWNGYCAAQ